MFEGRKTETEVAATADVAWLIGWLVGWLVGWLNCRLVRKPAHTNVPAVALQT